MHGRACRYEIAQAAGWWGHRRTGVDMLLTFLALWLVASCVAALLVGRFIHVGRGE